METIVWGPFLAAAILVGASPGASNFTAFANGARSGFMPGFLALCGRLIAFCILLVVVALGLGTLFTESEVLFNLIKWTGVGYLGWLSWQMWNSDQIPGESAARTGSNSIGSLLAREFLVAITNPKAILVFVAFVPQFVTDTRSAVKQLAMLTAVYIAVGFVAASGYVFAGSRLRVLRLTPKGVRNINRVTALLMLAAAVWLIFARE